MPTSRGRTNASTHSTLRFFSCAASEPYAVTALEECPLGKEYPCAATSMASALLSMSRSSFTLYSFTKYGRRRRTRFLIIGFHTLAISTFRPTYLPNSLLSPQYRKPMMPMSKISSPNADRLESSQQPKPLLPIVSCSHSISRISQSKKKTTPSVISEALLRKSFCIIPLSAPFCNPKRG